MRHMHHLPRPEEKEEHNYKETYFRLLNYAKPYWHLITVVLIFALVGSFIGVLPTQVMGVAVDKIFSFSRGEIGDSGGTISSSPANQQASERAGPTSVKKEFRKSIPIAPYIDRVAEYISVKWLSEYSPALVISVTLALTFLALFIVSQGISIIQGFIMVYVGQSLIYDMRSQVYEHLQRLSLKYFEDRQTGDVMARVVNDVDSLAQVIVGPVVRFITDIWSLIFVLYFCLSWAWELTLLALIAAPLLILVTKFFGKLLRKSFLELRQRIGELNGLLQDNISGIRVIKAFAREIHELGRFNQKSRENYEVRVRLGKLFRVFRPVIELLNQVGTLVVLCYGSILVFRGEIGPGIFVAFFRYLPRLYRPITGLSRFYNQIQQALASSERVFDVLDTEPEIKDAPDAVALDKVKGEVEFKNVHFSYDSDSEVLTDISLKARSGQMIAFVGPSGAGKTTLTNLIPRFYDPKKGNIFIDGYNLKELKSEPLRNQIGIVQQEPFLFNDTVKANIAYGELGASDEEIIDAAKAANAHKFIMEFSDQYEAEIGERGVKLSGGQKQRLSIARAILADPKILILDEATSSVDSETEILIQKAIDNLVKDRTTFVIAHRLSTIQHANLIVVLDDGKVVEMGKHEELLAQDGLYTRLHNVQFRLGKTEQPELPEEEEPPQRSAQPKMPKLDDIEDIY